jgi:hypothetical protein
MVRVRGDIPGNVLTQGGVSFIGHPLLGGSPRFVRRLAHTLYGAGYNSGAAPLTGDGTSKTYGANFVNLSGAAISIASVVFQGWTLRTTGTTDASASYDVTGSIEYPVGTQVGTYAVTVTAGGNVATSDITLSTPIPAGATFKVNAASTVANAATYILNLGFAGLRTYAKSTLLKKAIGGFGDSIMTNNGGSLITAATGRCPAYLNSITGTTATTYMASAGANFTKQVALCALLGVDWVMTNFGTNDFGGAVTLSTLQGYLTTARDMVRTAGMRYAHITMLPRTASSATVITASSTTSSGTLITMTVPDATKFTVNQFYSVAGAVETEYNGTKFCTAINTGSNTITLLFAGSASPTATGTITVTAWKPTLVAGLMTAFSASFAAGGSSARGLFNAWVRGGVFDGYVEWADACEPSRDSGRWLVAGEDSLLPAAQLITVASVVSTSRFTSNYNAGNSTFANGVLQPLTGANIGATKAGSTNTAGDLTVTAAFTNAQAIGDTYWALPGVGYMSDDGTHPRVAGGGKGGQPHLDNPMIAWITANT